MVEELDETMKSIIQCIIDNTNFKLEAGAGAGKTYSLIETLKYIKKDYPKRKILCITYTNNAKDEILERLDDQNNIIVSTIHDFIWKFISPFQKELRKKVNQLINEKIAELEKESNIERLKKYQEADLTLPIKYLNYEALHKGIISHDRVIELFISFLDNETFCKILIDSFSYIFIDEYQDADRNLLPKLLDTINTYKNGKYLVLGLYGDNMQQIFQKGIVEINSAVYSLISINKEDNYRSCEELIEVGNFLRNDAINQKCKNQNVRKNQIAFIFNTSSDVDLKNYNFESISFMDFKRLYLVHKQIAKEVGFSNLLELFKSKYQRDISNIIKNADDRFLYYMCSEIMPGIYDYKIGNFVTLMRQYKRENFNIDDLSEVKIKLDDIFNNMSISIKEFMQQMLVIEFFDKVRFDTICDSYKDTEDEEFLDNILNCSVEEYFNHYRQYSGNTKLETMHGVKGNEFENVIVNIEIPTPWNWYDFANYIRQNHRNDPSGINIRNRTQKLLYVACTRARSTLIINYIVNKDLTNKEIEDEKNHLKETFKSVFGNTMEFLEYNDDFGICEETKLYEEIAIGAI